MKYESPKSCQGELELRTNQYRYALLLDMDALVTSWEYHQGIFMVNRINEPTDYVIIKREEDVKSNGVRGLTINEWIDLENIIGE